NLVPWEGGYRHAEGNAAAHIKSTLVGTSQTIPIREGKLQLGRWQGIFLADFDGPRERTVRVTITAGRTPQQLGHVFASRNRSECAGIYCSEYSAAGMAMPTIIKSGINYP